MAITAFHMSQSKANADPLLPTTVKGKPGQCSSLPFIPILACTFILAALVLLVSQLDVNITDISISLCLARYEPKLQVLVVIFIGATLMLLVSMMRNIQISVYHRRLKSDSTAMRILNFIAAFSLIFSYVGFVLLAMFDVDDPDVKIIHAIGSYMYFAFSGLYGLLHMYLLCKQTQYPIICKIVFGVVAIAAIVSIIIYASNFEENYQFEWFAVALNAIYVGLMTVLFFVDPVEDELRDFFCCRKYDEYSNFCCWRRGQRK